MVRFLDPIQAIHQQCPGATKIDAEEILATCTKGRAAIKGYLGFFKEKFSRVGTDGSAFDVLFKSQPTQVGRFRYGSEDAGQFSIDGMDQMIAIGSEVYAQII